MISKAVHPRPWFLWSMLLLTILCTGFSAPNAQSSVAEEIDRAILLHSHLEFEQGITLATSLLERPDLEPVDQAAVYSVLSMLYYAMGEDYHNKAMEYLDEIMKVGPCDHDFTHIPFEYWNIDLRQNWYRLCSASDQLTCDSDMDTTIQTIAIMEFDNYSAGKYLEELGYMTKGLSDFFEMDFAMVNNLRVVERDKIDYLLKEVMMTKEGLVDEATAVRAGKILGAQIMVFGSVMQLDHKTRRMMVKAVKVETTEILVSAERSDNSNFFEMEKELVKELAKKLDLELNAETEELLDASGTTDNDAASLYSRGIYHMEKYEYSKAYDFFKQAYEKDNAFVEAKKKMDIYRPLAKSS